MNTVYIPSDSAARSVGSDETAKAIVALLDKNNVAAHIVRNGSRGLYWLEPLVEIDTPQGRIAFGNVDVATAKTLFADNKLPGIDHPHCLGLTEDIPALKMQNRISTQRFGIDEVAGSRFT